MIYNYNLISFIHFLLLHQPFHHTFWTVLLIAWLLLFRMNMTFGRQCSSCRILRFCLVQICCLGGLKRSRCGSTVHLFVLIYEILLSPLFFDSIFASHLSGKFRNMSQQERRIAASKDMPSLQKLEIAKYIDFSNHLSPETICQTNLSFSLL